MLKHRLSKIGSNFDCKERLERAGSVIVMTIKLKNDYNLEDCNWNVDRAEILSTWKMNLDSYTDLSNCSNWNQTLQQPLNDGYKR